MAGSLKDKTIKGAAWSFIDNIANQGATFLVGLLLARLLSPKEYGVMAIITIFIAISNSIIDSGFSSALIRKVKVQRIDYNTVFYFNLIVSLFLYLLLFSVSPFIGLFFHEPVLVPVMRVIGVILIINALAIIPRTIFVKEVDFKTQTKVSIISSVVSGIVGIALALKGFGVWSLVGQQLSRQFTNTLFLWIFSTWRPALEFSYSCFKEMFGFGSKLMLSGLLDTFYQQIYYIIIGRFYSSAQLGQYTRAEQFNVIFSSNLTSVVQRVSFPVLSSIQDDPVRLREAYRKVIKVMMLITFGCMLGLAAVAKPLLLFLIGNQWDLAASFLQIICFSGMLYPLHAINLNILQVKGRSDLFLKLEVIKKCLAIVPISLGILYGIKSMLIGSVVMSVVAYYVNSYYSAKLIHYSTWNQVKDILPTLLVSLFVAFIMWSLSFLSLPTFLMLFTQIIVGLFLAWFIYEHLDLSEYLEIKQLALSLLHKIKH